MLFKKCSERSFFLRISVFRTLSVFKKKPKKVLNPKKNLENSVLNPKKISKTVF